MNFTCGIALCTAQRSLLAWPLTFSSSSVTFHCPVSSRVFFFDLNQRKRKWDSGHHPVQVKQTGRNRERVTWTHAPHWDEPVRAGSSASGKRRPSSAARTDTRAAPKGGRRHREEEVFLYSYFLPFHRGRRRRRERARELPSSVGVAKGKSPSSASFRA